MVLQDEILAILSNSSLTQVQQAELLGALVQSQATPTPPAAPQAPVAPPTSVTMPVTGHVLPVVPAGYTIGEYFQIAAKAAGRDPNEEGAFLMGGGAGAAAKSLGVNGSDPASWPLIVDAWANYAAYDPAAVAAGAASDAANAAKNQGTGTLDISTLSTDDILYIQAIAGAKTFQVIQQLTNGSAIQIQAAINSPQAAQYSSYNPNSYQGTLQTQVGAIVQKLTPPAPTGKHA